MPAQVFRPSRVLSSESAYDLTFLSEQAISEGDPTIVVDLVNTALLDSRGLGALVRTLKALREVGGDLVLCNVYGQVRMVLEMSNLHKTFRIYETVEDFLRSHTALS